MSLYQSGLFGTAELSEHDIVYGDIWALGAHLLLVGDATNPGDIARLMRVAQGRVSAIITDPPYGQIRAQWDTPHFGFIPHLAEVSKEAATALLFCSLPYGFTLHQEMVSDGWVWRWDAVWTKNNAGYQVSKFQPLPAHEHIFAYARKGAQARVLTFNGYDAGEIGAVWEDRCTSSSGRTTHVYAVPLARIRQGQPDGRRWMRSVLHGRKKQELPKGLRTANPSQKPPELVEKLVLLVSHPGESVYDGFLGSGTTLLACERTGRRCFGIERSPACASDVLTGWIKLTNRDPLLLERL